MINLEIYAADLKLYEWSYTQHDQYFEIQTTNTTFEGDPLRYQGGFTIEKVEYFFNGNFSRIVPSECTVVSNRGIMDSFMDLEQSSG